MFVLLRNNRERFKEQFDEKQFMGESSMDLFFLEFKNDEPLYPAQTRLSLVRLGPIESFSRGSFVVFSDVFTL
jgi:hypothetical protein